VNKKALMAKAFAGPFLFLNPLKKVNGRRTTADSRLFPSTFAISAVLSTEDDFELGGEFLDVFVRAGERIAGFFLGCGFVAFVWIIWSRF
jgi:hypothetical protein